MKNPKSPPPMSMNDALASANPNHEISIRIHGELEQLTPAERLYWQASYYLGDALNGGLIQALSNDTGCLTDEVQRFAEQYCGEALVQVFAELKAAFALGVVPIDRKERNDAIDRLSDHWETDPFEALTARFYALAPEYEAGLLKLAATRSAEFRGLRGG